MTKATNNHDALVVAIEDMEESRENLEGLVQRLTIQNDVLVAALEVISGAIHSDEWDEMGALLEAIDKSVIAALEQVKS